MLAKYTSYFKGIVIKITISFLFLLSTFSYGQAEITIRQDTGQNSGNFGPFTGQTVYVAHYFPANEMQQYQGRILKNIEFYIASASPDHVLYLETLVYGQNTPQTPGEILNSQIIPLENVHLGWMNIELETPVEITGEDIWIGYAIENLSGTGPIGTDDGPPNLGFGDMYSEDGENWISFSTENSWFGRNWNIAGHLGLPVINQKDVGVSAIIDPVSGANLTENEEITIQIKNYGIETQTSIPYSVSWANQQFEGVYTGNLESEQFASVTLPVTADLSEYGTYIFEACTNLPGDELSDYDCIIKEVENRIPSLCDEGLYLFGCEYDRISYWKLGNIEISEIQCPEDDSSYLDFREFEHEFIPGETYTLTVMSPSYDQYFSLWIDYNDNLEFDTNEILIDNGFCELKDTEYTFQITIPENLPNGNHVMRIRTSMMTPITDACEQMNYGIAIDFTAKIINDLSINEVENNKIDIYPNPFNGIINIELHDEIRDNFIFKVIDLNGKTIFRQKNDKKSFAWDGSSLPKGVYILSIENNGNIVSRKIIKK